MSIKNIKNYEEVVESNLDEAVLHAVRNISVDWYKAFTAAIEQIRGRMGEAATTLNLEVPVSFQGSFWSIDINFEFGRSRLRVDVPVFHLSSTDEIILDLADFQDPTYSSKNFWVNDYEAGLPFALIMPVFQKEVEKVICNHKTDIAKYYNRPFWMLNRGDEENGDITGNLQVTIELYNDVFFEYSLNEIRTALCATLDVLGRSDECPELIIEINQPVLQAVVQNPIGNRSPVTFISDEFFTPAEDRFHTSSTWQIAKDEAFEEIVAETERNPEALTEWDGEFPEDGSTYYVRVMYHSSMSNSEWSLPVSFVSYELSEVKTPVIENIEPSIETGLSYDITVTTKEIEFAVGEGVHASTDWRVLDEDRNVLVSIDGDEDRLTSLVVNDIPHGNTIFVKLRYRTAQGEVSDWSLAHKVTLPTSTMLRPSIVHPGSLEVDVPGITEVIGSPFALTAGTTDHLSTDWQLARDADFTDLVRISLEDEVNLTTWMVSLPEDGKGYYLRNRYRSELGTTNWSTPVYYTTVNTVVLETPSLTITSLENDGGIHFEVTVASSPFSIVSGTDRHVSTDWRMESLDGEVVEEALGVVDDLRNWKVESLRHNSRYYITVRYNTETGESSDWSERIEVRTPVIAVERPSILEPLDGSDDISGLVEVVSSPLQLSYVGSTELLSTDWELSLEPDFSEIINSSYSDEVNLTTWNIRVFKDGRRYYLRVRYHTVLGVSEWSRTSSFVSTEPIGIDTPSIVDVVIDYEDDLKFSIELESSPLSTEDPDQVHKSSDWEVIDNYGQLLFSVEDSQTFKNSWSRTGVMGGSQLRFRVRYRTEDGSVTAWSDYRQVVVPSVSMLQPKILSPEMGETGLRSEMVFVSSPLELNFGEVELLGTNWELSLNSDFTNIVHSTNITSGDMLSWALTLDEDETEYFVRVCHISGLGTSVWSDPVSFTMTNTVTLGKPEVTSELIDSNGGLGFNVTFISSELVILTGSDRHTSSDWLLVDEEGDIMAQENGVVSPLVTWSVPNLGRDQRLFVSVRYHTATGETTEWSDSKEIVIPSIEIITPAITYPHEGQTDVRGDLVVRATNLALTHGSSTHISTDWELSKDPDFQTLEDSSYETTTDLTSWVVNIPKDESTYYLRVRYESELGHSDWSESVSFESSELIVVSKPTILDGVITIDEGVLFTLTVTADEIVTSEPDVHVRTDWELVDHLGQVIRSLEGTEEHLTEWVIEGLESSTSAFVRVRYYSETESVSEWSDVYGITMPTIAVVRPKITSPENGVLGVTKNLTLESNPFALTHGTTEHTGSTWQVSRNGTFTDILFESTEDATNLVSWDVVVPEDGGTYYARVKYHSEVGESQWSGAVAFATVRVGLQKPTITRNVFRVAEGVSFDLDLTSSNPVYTAGSEKHASTDWELLDGDDNVLYSTYQDEENLKTWNVESIPYGTVLYGRVRYHTQSGVTSEWSDKRQMRVPAIRPLNPVILFPSEGAVDIDGITTITSTEYEITQGETHHESSTWQLSESSTFATLVEESLRDEENLTSWDIKLPEDGRKYYVRVKYHSAVEDTNWSGVRSFSIVDLVLDTPEVYAAVTEVNAGIDYDVVFTSSSMTTAAGTDTHLSSDWELVDGDGNLIHSLYDSEDDLTVWEVDTLPLDADYAVRVRYKSSTGIYSEWSDRYEFRTPNITMDVPAITYPAALATELPDSFTITSTPLVLNEGFTPHVHTDWQIALDEDFEDIFLDSTEDEVNLDSWKVLLIDDGRTYYARVRYTTVLGTTDWSEVVEFALENRVVLEAPIVVSGELVNEGGLTFGGTMTSSPLVVLNGKDTHASTDWEYRDEEGNVIHSLYGVEGDNTSWVMTGVDYGLVASVRVRYHTELGYSTEWSLDYTADTPVIRALKPVITYPVHLTTDLSGQFDTTSTPVEYNVGRGTHISTEWQMSTSTNFSVLEDSVVLTEGDMYRWGLGILTDGTTHHLRVRYVTDVGTTPWSDTVTFTAVQTTAIERPTLSEPVLTLNEDLTYDIEIESSDFVILAGISSHKDTDWEILDGDGVVVSSSFADAVNKTSWSVANLNHSTDYFVRVRYRSLDNEVSSWSNAYKVAVPDIYMLKPVIISPTDGAVDVVGVIVVASSPLELNLGSTAHLSSDWELSLDPDFSSTVYKNHNDPHATTNWTVLIPQDGAKYYLRVRHTSVLGTTEWSDTVSFTALDVTRLQKPAIIGASYDQEGEGVYSVTLTTSPYTVLSGNSAHASSDWEFLNADEEIISSLSHLEEDLTSRTYTDIKISFKYYARVRFRAADNTTTEWSELYLVEVPPVMVEKPVILTDLQDKIDIHGEVLVEGSELVVVGGNYSHNFSVWELATDPEFGDTVVATGDHEDLDTWTMTVPVTGRVYYLRVKYGTLAGESEWSDVVSFTALVPYVTTPEVISDIIENDGGIQFNAEFASSEFGMDVGTDIHKSTDWELYDEEDTLIRSSYDTVIQAVLSQEFMDEYFGEGWEEQLATADYDNWDPEESDEPEMIPWTGTLEEAWIRLAGEMGYMGDDEDYVPPLPTYPVRDWSVTGLDRDGKYYVRVRYTSGDDVVSEWSEMYEIETPVIYTVAPTITTPQDGIVDFFGKLDIETSEAVLNIGNTNHLSTDWEVALDEDFEEIFASSTNDNANLTDWSVTIPKGLADYYIRARHTTVVGTSEWSEVVVVTAVATTILDTPSIIDHDFTLRPDLTYDLGVESDDFSVARGIAEHEKTDWEIRDADDLVVGSLTGSTSKLQDWSVTGLDHTSVYTVYVRYLADDGVYSDWSEGYEVTTPTITTKKPTITLPTGNEVDVFGEVVVKATPMELTYGTTTHIATDWQVSTDSDFSSTYAASLGDTSNLTQWTFNAETLGEPLYIRVRYRTAVDISPWSDTVSIETLGIMIHTPEILSVDVIPSTSATFMADIVASEFSGEGDVGVHNGTDWEILKDGIVVESEYDHDTEAPVTEEMLVETFGEDWAEQANVLHNLSILEIATPEIVDVEMLLDANETIHMTITANQFAVEAGTDEHGSTDWEIWKDDVLVESVYGDEVNGSGTLMWEIGGLEPETDYVIRVRYNGLTGKSSDWSEGYAIESLP